jgi:AraC family L-rhamnose operon transcriptional activator RhaR
MIKQTVEVTPAHIFFTDTLPYFVNRVSESFDLHVHEHEFTEISYVGEGSGFHYISEKAIPVSKGDLFIVPLGTSHVFRPRSADTSYPLVVYNFIFIASRVAEELRGFPGLEELSETLQLLNLAPGHARWRRIQDSSGVFHTLFTDAYQEFRLRQAGFVPRIHSLFVMLMTEIQRQLMHTGESDQEQLAVSERGMRQTLAFIHSNYASSITVGQAASALKMSERHLHRLFVKATGFTFNQYVQNTRIERSCELLRTTRLTIPEVAEAVGYQDKGYFLKLFKRKMGQTPRDYRS